MAESAAVTAVKQVLDRLLKYAQTHTGFLRSCETPDVTKACEVVRVLDSGLEKVQPQVDSNPVSLGQHYELLKQARRAVEEVMGCTILAGGAGIGDKIGQSAALSTQCHLECSSCRCGARSTSAKHAHWQPAFQCITARLAAPIFTKVS